MRAEPLRRLRLLQQRFGALLYTRNVRGFAGLEGLMAVIGVRQDATVGGWAQVRLSLVRSCPTGGATSDTDLGLSRRAAMYHRCAMQFLFCMKQTKLVKPKPVSKREVPVDTRTPSGRRTLPY